MAIFGFYRCELCGEELFEEKYFCKKCQEEIEVFLRMEKSEEEGYYVYSLFFYEGLIRDLIRRWKFKASPYMAGIMASLLARFIVENEIYMERLSFIPMHKKKRWTRGFDPIQDLSLALSKELSLPQLGVLERKRSTKSLYKLDPKSRKEELSGCFRALDSPEGGVLCLLDDIYTSGSTTREAARTLFEAGYQDFFFLIIAK